jgi:imidazolonepropionase-like amidohydrolase
MSPAEAIDAATSVAAKYLGLVDCGVVAEGIRSDLVLLESDPLVDIRKTRDVKAVWVEGRDNAGELVA